MISPPVSDRSLSAVLVRAFLFCAVGYVAAFALAYLASGAWRKGPPAGSLLEGAAWTAYLLLVSAVPAAFGFAVATSVFPAFRALTSAGVAGIAAAGGVAAYLVQTTGLAGFLYWIPLPLPGPIGAALRMLLPGVAIGLVAIFGVEVWRRAARSRTTRPAGRSSG